MAETDDSLLGYSGGDYLNGGGDGGDYLNGGGRVDICLLLPPEVIQLRTSQSWSIKFSFPVLGLASLPGGRVHL